jgi:hypothetical protein
VPLSLGRPSSLFWYSLSQTASIGCLLARLSYCRPILPGNLLCQPSIGPHFRQ